MLAKRVRSIQGGWYTSHLIDMFSSDSVCVDTIFLSNIGYEKRSLRQVGLLVVFFSFLTPVVRRSKTSKSIKEVEIMPAKRFRFFVILERLVR